MSNTTPAPAEPTPATPMAERTAPAASGEPPLPAPSAAEPSPRRTAVNRRKTIAIAASTLAAVSLAGAAVDHVRTNSALTDARRKAAAADHRAQQAEARPPKVVTKTLTKTVDKPVFGRSTILGAYAAGVIAGGVYSDSGSMSFTASDSTCSQQYSQISQEPNGGTVQRDLFMKACLTNVHDTAKTDPSP